MSENKIKITIGKVTIEAVMLRNNTAMDFINFLPLDIRMDDLFGIEKYGNLPGALSTDSQFQNTYEVGDIAYWAPSNDLAIYYKQDNKTIAKPGIIIIGKINININLFDIRHPLLLRIEKMKY